MCARCFITICEKDSISLWILELGICRSWRCLVVVVWKVPCFHALIIMGGRIVHPSWVRSGCRMVYLSSF